MRIDCNVQATARRADTGELVQREEAHNLLVTSGRNFVRDLLGGGASRPDQLAIGSSSTAPAAGDTALGSETLRKAIDRRVSTTGTVEYQTLIETSEGNGVDIKEIGVFRSSTLIARAVLGSPIAKTALIEVTISHVFSVTAG